MEKVTEQISKEEMYRDEIFKLLQASLDNFSAKDLELMKEIFMQEKISDEVILKKIIE
jgi:hypothetical protein